MRRLSDHRLCAVCQRHKKLFSPLEDQTRWRESSFLFLLYVLSLFCHDMRKFAKEEKKVLCHKTPGAVAMGEATGGWSFYRSAMRLKHWTNCTKLKGQTSKDTSEAVFELQSRSGGWTALWIFLSCIKTDFYCITDISQCITLLHTFSLHKYLHPGVDYSDTYFIHIFQKNLLWLIHTCLTRWFQMTSPEIKPIKSHRNYTRAHNKQNKDLKDSLDQPTWSPVGVLMIKHYLMNRY